MLSRRQFVRDTAVAIGSVMMSTKMRAQESSLAFDYVIVGAGASGCVLANRLSADSSARVLLLEAGGPDVNPLIHTPGKWTSLLDTDVDWKYVTEPESRLGGRRLKWPRGRTFGGSTAINAMAYVRGHRACFDGWAAAAGSAWSFANVLAVFRTLEDNSRGASEFHGAGGPLALSDTSDPHAGHVAFLEAARDHGFDASPRWDFNGARQEQAAGFYQKTIRDGRRHSAAAAFLDPVRSRSNLIVWSNAQALRLALTRGRVTGVDIVREGQPAHVRVNRSVVLAAGVIESPKILMLSGIGPADALRRHGLPAVVNLRGVGANLHDHPRVGVRWQARQPLEPSSVSAGLFTFSKRGAAASGRIPDLQFYIGRGLDVPDPFVTLTVALSVPRSRGSVTLRSADPMAAPLLQPNYFSDPADLEALVDGVRLARSLANAKAYEQIRGQAVDPDAAVQTAAQIKAYVHQRADTIFHPVGTCRMGSGPDAVVDGRLRVHGVEGLFVADASVMPTSVNSQTAAACLLIAERAAQFMR